MPHRLRSEQGIALVATTLLMLVMLCIGSAMMLYTAYELQTSGHYNTGNQAMYAAESGILRAVNIVNKTSSTNMNTDVVQHWGTLFSPATQSVPGYTQFQYTVTAAADATNPSRVAWLTSVGTAPNGARRIVRVAVSKSAGSGAGAIYLASDAINSSFAGNAFVINGNDHNSDNSLNPAGVTTPGISTHSDASLNNIVSALSTQQQNNITGLGFSSSPLTPSVLNTGGPDATTLTALVNQFTADARAVVESTTLMNGNRTYGTLASPQLTIATAASLKVNGNVTGAGILVVEGDLTISGTLDFVGWVIAVGGGGTTVTGNANITGSLWSGGSGFTMRGSGSLYWCSTCVNLMGTYIGNPGGGTGSGPATVTRWQEVL